MIPRCENDEFRFRTGQPLNVSSDVGLPLRAHFLNNEGKNTTAAEKPYTRVTGGFNVLKNRLNSNSPGYTVTGMSPRIGILSALILSLLVSPLFSHSGFAETETTGRADSGGARATEGVSPTFVVVDLDAAFKMHPKAVKIQDELKRRYEEMAKARQDDLEVVKKLVAEASALDAQIAGSSVEGKKLLELSTQRDEIAKKVQAFNDRTLEFRAEMERWRIGEIDKVGAGLIGLFHGLSADGRCVIVLDKGALTPDKLPAVLFSNDATDITRQTVESVQKGSALTTDALKDVPRGEKIAALNAYTVFNALQATTETNDEIEKINASAAGEIDKLGKELATLNKETKLIGDDIEHAGSNEEKKRKLRAVLSEKAQTFLKQEQVLKSLTAKRDEEIAEVKRTALARITGEITRVVKEMAMGAGADLVFDSGGQNSAETSIVIHLEGIPDWTSKVIEKMNAGAGENGKAQGEALTASTEHLHVATLDIMRVLQQGPEGRKLVQELAAADHRLKNLKTIGDESTQSREIAIASVTKFRQQILDDVESALARGEGETHFNLVFEIGGKTDDRFPLTLIHDKAPDLTEMVLKALRAKK